MKLCCSNRKLNEGYLSRAGIEAAFRSDGVFARHSYKIAYSPNAKKADALGDIAASA
jgi:hypothetical protein